MKPTGEGTQKERVDGEWNQQEEGAGAVGEEKSPGYIDVLTDVCPNRERLGGRYPAQFTVNLTSREEWIYRLVAGI